MRTIIEAVIAIALIAAAWEKPYREHLGEVIPALVPQTLSAHAKPARPSLISRDAHAPRSFPAEVMAAAPTAAPQHSGDWMWRPTALDHPGQSATPATFSKHIYYSDEKGAKYWLDAQGNRHYEK